MQLTDRRLERGDVVELGEIQDSFTEQPRGGGIRLIAAWDGEATPYVVLRFTAAGGESFDLPEDAEVLSVEDGQGMANPTVWAIVPRDAYGGGE